VRQPRAIGLAFLLGAALLTACGSEGAVPSDSSTTSPPAGGTVASTLTFGSGQECPDEPYCLPGLESTYGLTFAEFVVTDPGGPITLEKLRDGSIDVGVLFTTDPALLDDDLVLLEDDRGLQPPENVTPIVNGNIVRNYGDELRAAIDPVSAALTTDELAELNREVSQGGAPADVARQFLEDQQLVPGSSPEPRLIVVVVGSANFAESELLAELYAQAIEATGIPVDRQFRQGNRDAYYPLVSNGLLSVVPEYIGSLYGYLAPDQGLPTGVPEMHRVLDSRLRDDDVRALWPAPAENKNGIVVTKQTAERYGLDKVSDLAKPAARN
jgi:osmoprotectant transport system substrate-binding protein